VKKKKWLIGTGIVGALAVALLLGGLATGDFARASTLFSDPAITVDEAKAAALEAHPGTSVVEVELERGNSRLIYEVGLDNGLEVEVDANTGAVLGPEQEEADGSTDDADDGSEIQEAAEDADDVDDADEAGDIDNVDDTEDADGADND